MHLTLPDARSPKLPVPACSQWPGLSERGCGVLFPFIAFGDILAFLPHICQAFAGKIRKVFYGESAAFPGASAGISGKIAQKRKGLHY